MMKPSPALAALFLSLATVFAVHAEDGWFDLRATSDNGPSVIGMEDWLHKPAGRHGAVLMEKDRLVCEDGTPVKFWGVNLGGSDCTPSKEAADYWAERWARYGVNAVRFHKPWDNLYSDTDSTQLNPEAVERLDYFCKQLRDRGIYYTWSFFYHHRLREKDLEKLRHPQELIDAGKENIYGVVDYLPDVQQLLIDATLSMLAHKNPHTGLTYAEDPALAIIEFQNEASLMFWSGQNLPKMPNYQREFSQWFADFLKEKYGTHEKLVEAWGEEALNVFDYKDERLGETPIWASSNAYEMNPQGLEAAAEKGLRQRMLDNAAFLHAVQNDYYERYTKAIRDTGFKAGLIGSCWRGQGGITEYYNLRSDALVGIIDRHNYHGGLGGWKPRTGEKFTTGAQLNTPGSGLFSSGMMQVLDRPYAFSEWATVFPNEWTLESPSIIAIYGMGLQGWDASFQFATRTSGRGYSKDLASQRSNLLWNIEQPANIGIYPALARMILRGDVAEGEVISVRRVSLEDLHAGRIPWGDEWYSGWKDVKVYHGPMPGTALAAGRLAVEFVDEPADSTMPDMARYEKDGVVRSVTDQLVWDVSRPDRGFFTVNAPAARAVVGFRPDAPQELGDVTIEIKDVPFAGVFVTALDQDADLAGAERVLVTAVARARNTDMQYNEARDVLVEMGTEPIQLEGVSGRIAFADREIESVCVLDHDGRRTDRMLEPDGKAFAFNGAEDEAFYYEVVLK